MTKDPSVDSLLKCLQCLDACDYVQAYNPAAGYTGTPYAAAVGAPVAASPFYSDRPAAAAQVYQAPDVPAFDPRFAAAGGGGDPLDEV